MKVATKIATGTGIAIVVLLLVVGWDLSLVARLAETQRELSQVNFLASSITLHQSRLLNQMDEFTRKLHVTSDPAYADRLAGLRVEFARQLAELRNLDHPLPVRAEIVGLARQWEIYWRQLVGFEVVMLEADESQDLRQAELLQGLASLRAALERVGRAAETVVEEQAMKTLEVSGRARRVSWAVASSALLLCILVLWLTIRSIYRPLDQLTRGTRAVSEGEFSVQLEARGRDELSRLAESFNQMVRRLAEAERAKKDFLSHVSHELKTPLASMQETNELLLEEIAGTLNEKQKRFLALNLESSRRLSAMISKLLDLSRLEAGVMDYDIRRQDLVELTRTVAAGFEARAREQGTRVILQTPPGPIDIACDRDRMIQVLENLLDNALKFSPRDSAVEVRVLPPGIATSSVGIYGRSERGKVSPIAPDASAVVEIADVGPGVPDDQKTLIFERFHQVSGTGRAAAARGVGLGLAICREIMEAHNGWVAVRNNEGNGSVFSVGLPPKQVAQDGLARQKDGREDRSVVA